MAKARRGQRGDGEGKPSKVEKAVATYVRHQCPTKTSMVNGDEVHYMIGSKAIDCLLESKWSASKGAKEPLFHNRSSATEYMQGLLNLGMLWRARKLVPKTKPDETKNVKENKKEKGDGDKEDEPKEEKKDVKKKKRKVKLEFHQDQVFLDGSDVYVWHFDPITWTKFMIGLLLLFGSIIMCLFPLWPNWMRVGVYYCSLGAMGLIGVLFGLVILRAIVFSVVWAVTKGNHHLWILPNLTADCGVLESFQPAYSYENKSAPKSGSKSTAVGTKEKSSDVDEEKSEPENDEESCSAGEKSGEETGVTESSAPPSPQNNARRRARKAES